MADILWKLLVLLQLLQEDTGERQNDLTAEQLLYIHYFWKKIFPWDV